MPRSLRSWCLIKSACLSLLKEADVNANSPVAATIAKFTIIFLTITTTTTTIIKRVSREQGKKENYTKKILVKNCTFRPGLRSVAVQQRLKWSEIGDERLFYIFRRLFYPRHHPREAQTEAIACLSFPSKLYRVFFFYLKHFPSSNATLLYRFLRLWLRMRV